MRRLVVIRRPTLGFNSCSSRREKALIGLELRVTSYGLRVANELIQSLVTSAATRNGFPYHCVMNHEASNGSSTCPRCETPLTGDESAGGCPRCLSTALLSNVPVPETRLIRDIGAYELLEEIGRGGMGVVYKARQKSLNRTVALKMVHNWHSASSDTFARFRIEAEAAAKLAHPNIVPTYQIGEWDGQPFFSMKLIPGAKPGRKYRDLALVPLGDKSDAKATPRPTREAQARIATLLAKVARAVHFAHQHGIIHRDLKPNNILIDAEGEPHLSDFGLAKLIEQDSGLTRTNEVLGTPAYMAPEQATGKVVSSAVDVYSLGAILYELLTGQPPLRGKTPLETLRMVVEQEAVPPTTVNSSADPELAAICLKCLEKDPTRRYGTALDLAEDLERWIRHEPIQAKRASSFTRSIRWTRRNPVGASLILTLCGALLGALVFLKIVSVEKNKTAAVLSEVERAGQTNARLLSLTVSMLHEQLEGLWLSSDREVLHISSEQLAALSGLPIIEVAKKATIERYKFGLSANESPVADSQKYAMFLATLEQRMSERRGRPVRIDLHIFKFKEGRVQALVTNGLDLARMGPVYYLRTKQQHPGIQALVTMEVPAKTALFFTRTNTGIQSLAGLKGRRVAFGDHSAGITFGGLLKLTDSGLAGKDLAEYVFIDSRTEFIEEIQELGYEAALKRRTWLHSTADVIEEVVNGRYDAGVTTLRAFEKNRRRGLVEIPGSQFERTPSDWVARENLPSDVARDFIEVLTAFHNEPSLLQLPDRPSGFIVVTEPSHAPQRKAMPRVEELFPIPPTR